MTMTTVPGEAIEAAGALLLQSGTPGATIALKIDDAPVASVGVGGLDLAGNRPMAADARLPLYSITKTILAAAALRLVDAGQLSLDRDACELIPDVALPARITVRQLLGHTGGLPDYGQLREYSGDLRADPAHPWNDEEFVDRTLGRGLLFAPGEGWAYSNLGYLLVRRIVATLGGDGSLPVALDRLVFAPAGVEQAAVATSLADMACLVPGFSRQLGRADDLVDVRSRYHPGWVAHGLVTATAADTATLVAALFDGGLLAPGTLAEMLRGVPVGASHPPFRTAGYGLGLMIDLDPVVALVAGHAGGGPGYSTAAFRFETAGGRRVTSIALANRDADDIGLQIAFATARIALGLPD
jgi:D-alanyl-D-alanine carboxypeptidase